MWTSPATIAVRFDQRLERPALALFMKIMEKKFDEMDKGKKGMLSIDDVMRIYGRSDKG
jgi:hypothetical protein